jgi:hypothetical protein
MIIAVAQSPVRVMTNVPLLPQSWLEYQYYEVAAKAFFDQNIPS